MALKRLTAADGAVYYASVGTDQHGQRFYVTCRYDDGSYCNFRDAKQMDAELCRQVGKGTFIHPSTKRLAFRELAAAFLEAKRDRIRPITLQGYEAHLITHILPFFADYQLGKVDFRELIRGRKAADKFQGGFVNELKGRTYRNRPISYRQINKILTTLYSVMEFAVSEGYIAVNPVRAEDRPRESILPLDDPHRRPMAPIRVIPLTSIEPFIAAADPGLFRTLFTATLLTGMREGEILGLKWGDIDWQEELIHVRRGLAQLKGSRFGFFDPKTSKSSRTLPRDTELEDLTALDLFGALRAWKLASSKSDLGDLVFCRPDGRPLAREWIRERGFLPAIRRAKIAEVRFYDLRHTYVSLLIYLRRHPKEIADRVGHSSIAITMDVYGHLMEASPTVTHSKLEVRHGKL